MTLKKQLMQTMSKYPNNIAMACGDKNVTYRELKDLVDLYVNNILHKIPDTRIGLIADQSINSIACLIATVVAEKTIVPIDPRLSTEDIDSMLSCLTRSVLIDDNFQIDKGKSNLTFYKISDLLKELSTPPKDKHPVLRSDEAYILHTSGTTGQPKSVLATAESLQWVASKLAKAYYIDNTSKVIQFAYLSFDSAFAEIWATLLNGAALIIPGSRIRGNLYGTFSNIAEEYSDLTVTLPPSVAENLDNDTLDSIKTLVLAGEELPSVLANTLLGKVEHLINAYGPTESIICATTYEIKKKIARRVPIGQPLDGMKITLDPQTNEMLLHSKYLAKGYIGHDNKKAFHDSRGERYYRTGDIATIDDNGNYIFMGRVDRQIKMNGQRLELEGLESRLRSGTGNSLVYLVNITAPNQTTNLYCLYKSKDSYSVTFLNSFLPNNITLSGSRDIDKVPLSSNGKVDYEGLKKLLNLDNNKPKLSPKRRDVRLLEMIDLWQSVFGADIPITGSTAFFDIGGDSLIALKLVALINDKYSIELKLTDIIDNDTPEMLVGLLG